MFKVNPHIDRNIVIPTVCALSKTISLRLFILVLVMSLLPDLKKKSRKGFMEGLLANIPDLEEPKATKTTRGPTTD